MRLIARPILALFLAAAAALAPSLAHAAPDSPSFQKADLDALISYIDSFRDAHHRLPTQQEFSERAQREHLPAPPWYYTDRPDFLGSWGRDGRDYLVGEGEASRVLYYTSWNQRYVEVEQP